MLMGFLAKLDNIIHSVNYDHEKVKQAEEMHKKLLGNYKLTKNDVKFLESI